MKCKNESMLLTILLETHGKILKMNKIYIAYSIIFVVRKMKKKFNFHNGKNKGTKLSFQFFKIPF